MIADDAAAAIARTILAAADDGHPLTPFTDADGGFRLADAYAVAAAVLRLRQARGERPVGWKIGFTNRTIWDEYGVHAPIWGPMFDTTVAPLKPSPLPVLTREAEPSLEGVEEGGKEVLPYPVPLAGLQQPRLEPEIYLRLAEAPRPGMDEPALLACIDAVGHGIELVQSLFPDWRFRGPDTVAALALHGGYRFGPPAPIASARGDWLKALTTFGIRLDRDGAEVDRGVAANILGHGPLTALRHLVDGLAASGFDLPLSPGDLVTTGTLTRAFPVSPGERWTTHLTGIPLAGIDIAFGP